MRKWWGVKAGSGPAFSPGPALRARWLALLVGCVTAYWLVYTIASALGAPGRASGIAAAATYFALVAAAAVVLLQLVRRSGIPLARIGLWGRPRLVDFAMGVSAFLVAGMFWPLVEWVVTSVGAPMFWKDSPSLLASGANPAFLILFIGLGAIMAVPVAEELWFRGYLLTLLHARTGSVPIALATTSLLFGVMHLYGGPGFALFVTIWAFAPGLLFLWTRRLWAPILVHVLNNLWAHVAVPLIFVD